jgi:hypothetical protein
VTELLARDSVITRAILDRLLPREYCINLKGETPHRQRPDIPRKPEESDTAN